MNVLSILSSWILIVVGAAAMINSAASVEMKGRSRFNLIEVDELAPSRPDKLG